MLLLTIVGAVAFAPAHYLRLHGLNNTHHVIAKQYKLAFFLSSVNSHTQLDNTQTLHQAISPKLQSNQVNVFLPQAIIHDVRRH